MTRVPLDGGFSLNLERMGSGPALVLLHGFTGSAMSWGPLAEMLAARFTLFAVDIVGHGASSKPEELDHYAMDRAAAFVDHWESVPLFATQARLPTGMRRAIRRGRLANDAQGLANSLRGMGTGAQPALHESLGGIEAPSLLIAGSRDTKFATIAEEMAAAMPNARALSVADAGHAPHIEKPAYCVRTITAFLQEGEREREHGGSLGAGG